MDASGKDTARSDSYERMMEDPADWIERGPTAPPIRPAVASSVAAAAEAAPAALAAPDAFELAQPAQMASSGGGLFHVDWRRYYTKAFLSNAATSALMVAGVLMRALGVVYGTRWVLAAGVFGFAGTPRVLYLWRPRTGGLLRVGRLSLLLALHAAIAS